MAGGKGGKWGLVTLVVVGAGVYYYTQRRAKTPSAMINEAAKDVKSGVNTVAGAANVAVDTAAGGATAVADTVGKAVK